MNTTLPVAQSEKLVVSKPARKRAKHTRSKLGCGTCRIRRVRCDQTRPFCERCTKTGRKCDGYPAEIDAIAPEDQIQNSGTSKMILSSSTPRALLPQTIRILDFPADRSLYYWQHKAAVEFPGYFHNDLWSTLVLQISRREECVRQIVVALGLLHESFHKEYANVRDPITTRELRKQAFNHYSKGVRLLNQHITQHGWAELEITLLCSILCVTFEWLRGDYPSAHTHLRSSLSIMSQWHGKGTFAPNSTSFWSPSGHLIRNKLRPLCTSLVLQARTMPISPSLPATLPMDLEDDFKPFTSLQEARESLDITLAYTLPETIARKAATPLDRARNWELTSRLARWSHYFTDFLSTQKPGGEDTPRITLMNLWHIASRMIFMGSLSEDEGDSDGFLTEFQYIVDNVEDLLSPVASYFSVDIGVVPLLYYVALKCRDPIIRRRAIAMLESAPRREAVWDSTGAALVTREVVNAEEAGLGPVCRASDIPNYCRIYTLALTTDVEHRTIRMKTKRQGDDAWGNEKVLIW